MRALSVEVQTFLAFDRIKLIEYIKIGHCPVDMSEKR